jgi:hypothetical protein
VDYTIDHLVGAIKVRVQEQGGTIVPLSAMGEAKRVQREAAYLADRESLMRDRRWIEENVHRSFRAAMLEIVRLVDEANMSHGFQIQRGAHGRSCVLRTGFVSMESGDISRSSISSAIMGLTNATCMWLNSPAR